MNESFEALGRALENRGHVVEISAMGIEALWMPTGIDGANPLEGIVADADGTIFNSKAYTQAKAEADFAIVAEMLLEKARDDRLITFPPTLHTIDQIAEMLTQQEKEYSDEHKSKRSEFYKSLHIDMEELQKRRLQVWKNLVDEYFPFPNQELIDTLALIPENVVVILNSNSPKGIVERALRRLLAEPGVDINTLLKRVNIICADEEIGIKPDPAFFDNIRALAMKNTGRNFFWDRTVLIGDNPRNDVLPMLNRGAGGICVDREFYNEGSAPGGEAFCNAIRLLFSHQDGIKIK